MRRPRPEEILMRFTPPSAPTALRDHVLLLARRATEEAAAPSLADQIWHSRRWRLAWAASLALTLLVEWMAGAAGRPRASMPAMREADAVALTLGLPAAGWIGDRVGSPEDGGADWPRLPEDVEETP